MILAGLILIITFLAAAPRFGITLFALIILYKKKPTWFMMLWLNFISMAVIDAFAEMQTNWWICVKFLDLSDRLFNLLVKWQIMKPMYLTDHTFKLFMLAIILTLFYLSISLLYKNWEKKQYSNLQSINNNLDKNISIQKKKIKKENINNKKNKNQFEIPEFKVDFAGSKEDFNEKYKDFL